MTQSMARHRSVQKKQQRDFETETRGVLAARGIGADKVGQSWEQQRLSKQGTKKSDVKVINRGYSRMRNRKREMEEEEKRR